MLEKRGKLPDAVVACVGGGSNATGMFYPFSKNPSVKLLGVEAGGDGIDTGRHSATLTGVQKVSSTASERMSYKTSMDKSRTHIPYPQVLAIPV